MVGWIEDGVEPDSLLPDKVEPEAALMQIHLLGDPTDRDTADTMWQLVLEADVVVGLSFMGPDGETRGVAPNVAELLAVACAWAKPAILCSDRPRDHERRDVHAPDIVEMSPDECRFYLCKLAAIDWHAPNALAWRRSLNEIDERLPVTPMSERILGGPFAGLLAFPTLEVVREVMTGRASPLTVVLRAYTDAIALPEPPAEQAARAFFISQSNDQHWFRWPDGFLEWSKKCLVGLRTTTHPQGYFDRAMRDVRGWDLRCVAELLRQRAQLHGPGLLADELRLVADVVELALRVGPRGEIDAEEVASIGIVRTKDRPKYGPGAR